MTELNKENIVNSLIERRNLDTEYIDINSIYDYALEDLAELTHRETIDDSFKGLLIDMIEYRINTLSTVGIETESFSGISAAYAQDYPQRIMRRIRVRRLYTGGQDESQI